jgi:hypothetical protein
MKTIFASFFLFCIYFAANAQSFAIINDKDGYVNIRENRSITSRIVGKINNDCVFSYDESDKSDWVRVYTQYTEDASGGTAGFVHKSRILPLSAFKTIKTTKFLKDSCIARNDSLIVIIKSSPFNPAKHRLFYADKELKKIDGKFIWGTDGEVPKTTISSLKIIRKGEVITVPQSALNNLYEPRFETLKVFAGANDSIYIELDNSDGAGAYSIIWTIKGNKYLKKFIVSNA